MRSWRLLPVLLLVGCGTSIVETKEYSCAPQNIHYFQSILACERAMAVSDPDWSNRTLMFHCKDGTYEEKSGIYSCIDNEGTKFVIKPILLTREEQFTKKIDCEKLIPQIEKRVKEDDEDSSFNLVRQMTTVEKVFYSVSMNSCLYISTVRTYFPDKSVFETYWVSDALTGQGLLNEGQGEVQFGSESYLKTKNSFNESLKVYE